MHGADLSECRAVVQPVESLSIVVSVRVQRLMPTHRRDGCFYQLVLITIARTFGNRDRSPEAGVDVGTSRHERIQRPGAGAAGAVRLAEPQRAEPYGAHSNVLVEPVDELGDPCDWHLDILDDSLPLRFAPHPVELGDESEPRVVPGEPVVEVAAPIPRRPDPAREAVL